jgi:hypothetical protein
VAGALPPAPRPGSGRPDAHRPGQAYGW